MSSDSGEKKAIVMLALFYTLMERAGSLSAYYSGKVRTHKIYPLYFATDDFFIAETPAAMRMC